MSEQAIRDNLVKWGKSLFERGLTAGSSGNMSVRLDDGFLFTPTNSCLGFLEADKISKLDLSRQTCLGRRADQGTAAAFRLLRPAPGLARGRASALDLCDGAVLPVRHRSQ